MKSNGLPQLWTRVRSRHGASKNVIGFRSETAIPPNLSDWLDLARGLAAVEVLALHSYELMFQRELPGAGYDASIVFAYSALWALSAHGIPAMMVFFVLVADLRWFERKTVG
jgi:hypothetical protein